MSVAEINTARVTCQIAVQEILKGLAGGDGSYSRPTVGAQNTYNSTSTPPGVYCSRQTLALVAGAATIDLTALAGGLQDTIDGTGKKLQAFMISGASGNGALTISEGAANPYEIMGPANPIVYPAACTKDWLFQFDGKLAVIAAGAKSIDFAGTGTEEFEITIIIG